jgi:flagellin-like hook-associated protein FlgL
VRDIESRLAKAEAAVLLVTNHAQRQRQLLSNLERDGPEDAASRARAVLRTMEKGLQLVIEARDRLKDKAVGGDNRQAGR